MPLVEWNEEKNRLLKLTRGVCFEDVVNCVINDEVIDILPHHNPDKYPNQKIFVVRIDGYIYYVPFVEDDEKIFLKNIIPSRKLNTRYQ